MRRMAAAVAHRPLAPNCKPIGLLWPAGDWVSRATSPRFMAETVAPRAPLGPNATRSVVFCSAHKAGHTLGVSLAARLRPFVPNAHFFEDCSERNLRAACASVRGASAHARGLACACVCAYMIVCMCMCVRACVCMRVQALRACASWSSEN